MKSRLSIFLTCCFCLLPHMLQATEINLPGLDINFSTDGKAENEKVNTAFKILLLMTILSLAPAILIVTTSFTRIIIVLSILRHAMGMQQTPPNTVLISLALFLTFFSMATTFNQINSQVAEPYKNEEITTQQALDKTANIMKTFMLAQTRESDISLIYELRKEPIPKQAMDVSFLSLLPAFMISELKTAFQIGFVIFLPFLLVDIVVASILLSMGMLMVPPLMISLPIKILMFVLIDGWALVVYSLMGSFN